MARAQAPERDANDFDAGGVLLSPTRYRVNVPAGKRAALRFVTANPGTRRSTARIVIKTYMPENGSYVARDAEPHPHDAAGWFAERNFDVEYAPGQRIEHFFKYAVPRNTPVGSYWCLLELTARPVQSTSQAKVIVQAPIVFTIGRRKPQIKVTTPHAEMGVMPFIGPTMLVKLPLENEGETLAIVGATGELKALSTARRLTTFRVNNKDLLPGTRRDLMFSLPRLSDGNYQASFKVEINNRVLPVVHADFVVLRGQVQMASEAASLEMPPIVVDPEGFTLAAPAGSTRVQSLTLTNLSDRILTVDIAARPVAQSENGAIGLGEGDLPAGLSVAVAPAAITLRPRARMAARVVVRADKDLSGEQWFGLALNERDRPDSFSETVLGSVSVPGTVQPQLEIQDAAIQYDGKIPVAVTYVVHNNGNQALQLVPRVTVLENGVKMVMILEVPATGSGGILPNVRLPFLVQLPPEIRPGDYTVEIAYQYANGTYARSRAPFTIAAPPAPKNAEKKSTAKPSSTPAKKSPPGQPKNNKPANNKPASNKPAVKKPLAKKTPTRASSITKSSSRKVLP